MSRAFIILNGPADRRRAHQLIDTAPTGTRIEARGAKRTLDQNALLWVLLTEVAAKGSHAGQKFTPDQWKVLFMHACGQEVQFIQALDGKTFLPWGNRSSHLSKSQMADLIDFIHAWAAENGVELSVPPDTSRRQGQAA